MEKVEDSVDENSLADFNDLKDTRNELVSNKIEHPISKENTDQEDDISKVSPEIAVSSDLSRPTGFEHIKRTSSKYSTSFARYQKKDIKGVSLIKELSRIIEVGDSLESKLTCLETFRLKSMRGNYNFNFACSMARGRSGGLISIWVSNSFVKDDIWSDDAFIIVKGHWRNTVGDCYMIKIYGPQHSLAKAILWNLIGDFMHQHAGKYIIFGDMNVVRNEKERSAFLFSRHDADSFNLFIDNFGLIDLPLGGRLFTWMNKAVTKLSKLDRFLISEEVAEALPDVRVTAIDRLWSDHIPILFHVSKSDFGPTPFKLFHSWLLSRIKQWHSKTKNSNRVTKRDNLQLIKSIEEKIKASSVNDNDHDSRIKLLEEAEKAKKESLNDSRYHERRSNSSFFTLIPKVSNPIFIKDFCPISLIGVYYKIIANKLAKVIDKIFSHEKSAFIAGHQILDGLLILSEIVEWFKKEGKVVNFKVDFEKAFDSVSSKYLDFFLLILGFSSKWRSWIRACLS
nr:RNA-directed DNA polymerase, eukaryota, reverse transcriptase zinc-binding domain protein [Tanacetum cinerariifolium]